MPRTVSSLIAGRAREGAPGGTQDIPNPARLDEIVATSGWPTPPPSWPPAPRADAQRGWASVPAPVRGRAIQQIGRLVEDNKEALARLVTREIGKPYAESLGEVQEVVDTCNFFVSEGRRLYGQTVPSEMPDKQLFTFRNPVGVAAIITAGNFPVAVPSWYLVPALLCGNAVVWKPAEYAPAIARGARGAVPSRGSARGRVQPRAGRRRRRRSRGSSRRSRRASSTRSGSPARATWAGGSASSAAATSSRPASSSAARTRWW